MIVGNKGFGLFWEGRSELYLLVGIIGFIIDCFKGGSLMLVCFVLNFSY